MIIPSYYVETSVWGSLGPRQPADRKQVVRRMLDLLDGRRGVCVISEAVEEESDVAPAAVTAAIRRGIVRVQPLVYPVTNEMEALARAYIAAGVLPERRETDAVHVAAATCLGNEYLVSWNHRHMTRPLIRLQYESVNRLNGYMKTPFICNPWEACNELQSRRLPEGS